MNVALWAEIRRLAEIEHFSGRAIARRLHCSRDTVRRALGSPTAPGPQRATRGSILDPFHAQIQRLLDEYPELSAVRIHEEIARGPEGYRGSVRLLRAYLCRIRPARTRVYQEVHYEPGDAMQVDWGDCGSIQIGSTTRRVSVFVAVLCWSRMLYLEFTLSQKKAEFYRSIVAALHFYQGSPRKLIFDNLKAAVLSGSGRHAYLHPELLALCGHFYMQAIACQRRDPESKGVVEAAVRYIKRNALEGRAQELVTWPDYALCAVQWRDQVANVRLHETTRARPIDRFREEQPRLRPLPELPFDTDDVVPAIVTPHARVHYDSNRYSVPPGFVRKPVTVRASHAQVRVLYEGQEIACHDRSYEKRRIICLPDHQLAALQRRRRAAASQLENEFDALGPEARRFHLELLRRPVKATVHLRRLLALGRLYGKIVLCDALRQAIGYETFDAAYVETLIHQQRRRQQLPSPMPLCPKRRELIDEIHLDEPDPAAYDRFLDIAPEESL